MRCSYFIAVSLFPFTFGLDVGFLLTESWMLFRTLPFSEVMAQSQENWV
jgi:hypothetical protein